MVYFLNLRITYVFVYLRTKFQVSTIILTSFRRGQFSLPQNEPLKSSPRLGLTGSFRLLLWFTV